MTTRVKKSSTNAMLVTAIVVAAVWMAWPATREAAAQEYDFLAYGVATISPGETARLHVVTLGIRDVQPAELIIYNREGNILAHSTEYLRPGSAVALDLSFPEPPGTTVPGNRLEFYAEIRFARQRGPDRGYVIPSLEVLDSDTGKTIRMIVDPIG